MRGKGIKMQLGLLPLGEQSQVLVSKPSGKIALTMEMQRLSPEDCPQEGCLCLVSISVINTRNKSHVGEGMVYLIYRLCSP